MLRRTTTATDPTAAAHARMLPSPPHAIRASSSEEVQDVSVAQQAARPRWRQVCRAGPGRRVPAHRMHVAECGPRQMLRPAQRSSMQLGSQERVPKLLAIVRLQRSVPHGRRWRATERMREGRRHRLWRHTQHVRSHSKGPRVVVAARHKIHNRGFQVWTRIFCEREAVVRAHGERAGCAGAVGTQLPVRPALRLLSESRR
mmetsp:Transcript_75746/g.216926  ORF Transcript_75746/g.216926 Transcript_75746/m.216926 type:complete len:201 (-) Transcript_75746:38-640(-)